jgi:ABC-type transport system involved in cytochrome c biogenesis permease subunit
VTGRTLLRVSLAVGLACCGMLALAGGIVLHGGSLVALLIAAGIAAGVAYVLGADYAAPRGVLAVKAAAAMTAIGMVATGIGVLAGAAVAATVTASAMVAAGGLFWLRQLVRRRSGRAGTVTFVGRGPTPMKKRPDPLLSVSLLSTRALCGEWVHSTAALAGRLDPAVRRDVVRRRAEALDELERRDPVGFARWLASDRGARRDPAEFVREDRTMGRDAA